MDRRPLTMLLAAALVLGAPAVAGAASFDALMAQGGGGTLSDTPDGLTAQASSGTLSDTPTEAGSGDSSSGSSGAGSGSGSSSSSTSSSASSSSKGSKRSTGAAAADALPFTGSDPRVTLLLGLAALLAGAGLRLRTGDARDF